MSEIINNTDGITTRFIDKTINITQSTEPWFQSILLLWLRLSLAYVFFLSGLTKIDNFDSTVSLFEYEYAVPLLSPVLAAILAIGAELILTPLLALGLSTRLVAFALLIFNAVAMRSYPDISFAGIKEHELWQLGFLVLVLFGAGKVSADHWLLRKWQGIRGYAFK